MVATKLVCSSELLGEDGSPCGPVGVESATRRNAELVDSLQHKVEVLAWTNDGECILSEAKAILDGADQEDMAYEWVSPTRTQGVARTIPIHPMSSVETQVVGVSEEICAILTRLPEGGEHALAVVNLRVEDTPVSGNGHSFLHERGHVPHRPTFTRYPLCSYLLAIEKLVVVCRSRVALREQVLELVKSNMNARPCVENGQLRGQKLCP